MKSYISALLLPALAAAQYGYAPPDNTPATTNAARAAPSAPADTPGHMNINVASSGSFSFSPNNIQAPVGTLVTFWFPDGGIDHSVTQSTFENPCTYLAASGNSSAGFDSGLTSASSFTINVTSTDPIWFYCKQAGHCGLGMVGAINAPSNGDNSFDNFVSAAKAAGPNAGSQPTGFATGGANGVATGPPAPDNTGSPSSSGSSGSSGSSSDAIRLVVGSGISALAAGIVAMLL